MKLKWSLMGFKLLFVGLLGTCLTICEPVFAEVNYLVHREIGELLNPPGKAWSKPIQDAHKSVNQIISKLNSNNPRRDDFHWILAIHAGAKPFLAAELYSDMTDQKKYQELCDFYGVTKDKPIALVQASAGFLSFYKSESQLAFALGHELTHHTEGHTRETKSGNARLMISRQANESVADKGSLDLMAGKFSIEAAHPALLALITEAEKNDKTELTVGEQYELVKDTMMQDHHHPGLRLAMLRQAEEALATKTPSARGITDRPLPAFMQTLATAYAGKMPRAVKVSLIELFKDTRKYAVLDPLYRDGTKKFLTSVPEFWSYTDTPEFLAKALQYLEQSQLPEDPKAKFLLTFFMMEKETNSGLADFFKYARPSVLQQIRRILNGLQDSPILSDRETSDWHERLKRWTKLSDIILDLSHSNPAWNQVVTKLQSSKIPNSETDLALRVPSAKQLKSEWGKLEIREYLLALEKLDNERYEKLESKMLVTKILNGLKEPEVQKESAVLIGKERLNAILLRAENSLIKTYNERKQQSQSVPSEESQFKFVHIWLLRASSQPATYIHLDRGLFLKTLSNMKLGALSTVTAVSSGNWDSLQALMLPAIFAETMLTPDEKLRSLLQFMSLADGKNYIDILASRDPQFKKSLIDLYLKNQDPVGVILNIENGKLARSPIYNNETRMRLIGVFENLNLTDEHFISAKGTQELDKQIKQYEATLKAIPDHGTRLTVDHLLPKEDNARILLKWALLQKNNDFVLRTLNVLSSNYKLSPEELQETSRVIEARLKSLSGTERMNELKTYVVRRGLPREKLAQQLTQVVYEAKLQGQDIPKLWESLSRDFDFARTGNELGHEVRQLVAEKTQVQPGPANKALPIPELSDTSRTQNFSATIRLWSGVIALIQHQNFESQLLALDYLMGRSKIMPDFIEALHAHDSGKANIRQQTENLRSQLAHESSFNRTFFVNSLLEGPKAKIMSASSRAALMKYLLKNVSADKRAVTQDSISSMIEAEGSRAASLVSQVLAKKEISETSLVQVALENYFVPGLKLGQYLAFTGQFKHYESVLAHVQDSVPTDGYYDLMTYVYGILKDKMDISQIEFTRVLGAGTVNIAIEYLNLQTKKYEVFHVPRENIEEKTRADFVRFEKFANILAEKSGPGKDYKFIAGLVRLIRDSVQLEFNREASMQRQNEAFDIYNGRAIGSWKLQSVRANSLIGKAILMGKGPGITAKKLWDKDPALYKEIMGGLYKFERKRIFQIFDKDEKKFIRLANPDLHDGQVLIDQTNKTMTVIDFGQSLPISQSQINFGLDLVSIMTGVKNKNKSLEYLNQWLDYAGSKNRIAAEDLAKILENKDPMDRFIRLISKLEISEAPLPLAVVHLVLQLNRVAKLGEKVGGYPKLAIGIHLLWNEIKSLRSNTLRYSAPQVPATTDAGVQAPLCRKVLLR